MMNWDEDVFESFAVATYRHDPLEVKRSCLACPPHKPNTQVKSSPSKVKVLDENQDINLLILIEM